VEVRIRYKDQSTAKLVATIKRPTMSLLSAPDASNAASATVNVQTSGAPGTNPAATTTAGEAITTETVIIGALRRAAPARPSNPHSLVSFSQPPSPSAPSSSLRRPSPLPAIAVFAPWRPRATWRASRSSWPRPRPRRTFATMPSRASDPRPPPQGIPPQPCVCFVVLCHAMKLWGGRVSLLFVTADRARQSAAGPAAAGVAASPTRTAPRRRLPISVGQATRGYAQRSARTFLGAELQLGHVLAQVAVPQHKAAAVLVHAAGPLHAGHAHLQVRQSVFGQLLSTAKVSSTQHGAAPTCLEQLRYSRLGHGAVLCKCRADLAARRRHVALRLCAFFSIT
jgi:hypothetical protein